MSESARPSYFELFDLPETFEVDREQLAERYRELQREAHPDRHADGSDSERLAAVQRAAWINEGYRVLKDPVARARYLLERRGVAIDDEQNTAMDPAFLMEQMELREKLAGIRDEADPFGELERLRSGLEESLRNEQKALGDAFEAGDAEALARAADGVRRLQFLNKLASEVDEMEEALDDAL